MNTSFKSDSIQAIATYFSGKATVSVAGEGVTVYFNRGEGVLSVGFCLYSSFGKMFLSEAVHVCQSGKFVNGVSNKYRFSSVEELLAGLSARWN